MEVVSELVETADPQRRHRSHRDLRRPPCRIAPWCEIVWYMPLFDGSSRLTYFLAMVLAVVNLVNLPGGLAFGLQVKGRLHVKGRTGHAESVGHVAGGKVRSRANGIANGIAGAYRAPPQEAHSGTSVSQEACWTTSNAERRWPCQSRKLQRHSDVRIDEGHACAQRTGMVGAVSSGGEWGGFGLNSWPPGRGSLGATVPMAETCSRLLGPESVSGKSGARRDKTDSNGGGGKGGGGRDGGGAGREGGNGGGGQRGNNGDNGDSSPVVNNSTMIASSNSITLESGVEIDRSLLNRSPLARTLAPFFRFFQSRLGLYGIMLGYVAFTLSQHISPIYLGISFLAAIGPNPARKLLVVGARSLSVLTVASYVQDQFRHQVYPLPAVVAGPSAPYAVITGGSSGIGREIANELAGRGYNILLVARGKEELKKAAKELRETSRETAEAARRKKEDGNQEPAVPESRGARKRRLRQERQERRRRSERLSVKEAEPSDAGAEHSRSNSSHLSNATHPHDEGWSEQQAVRVASLPHNLENAITARWFAADLRNSTAAAAVHDEVKRLNITVEILVNAAGVCRVGRLESCSEEDVEAQLLLNVMGTTLLTRLFVKDFVKRRRGRVMMVSSVTAAAPIPTVASYAASKSYLTSLAEALHSEVEISGVGVTCVMPGATRTNFEHNSGCASSLVWRLPLVRMEADEVAARAVEALMRGDRTVITGWQNKLYVHVLAPLLPRKILMSFSAAMWR